MKKILIGIFCALMAFSVCAEEKVYLWPGKKGPGSENFQAEQVVKTKNDGSIESITSVSEPYFTVKKAKKSKNKKAGIIMFAGGGYTRIAMGGTVTVAEKYCSEGYTCFIVVYRLPSEEGHTGLVPLQDGQRAIRLVRSQVAKYGIDQNKIGVYGESAGCHIAAYLSTRYDEKIYEPVDEADSVSARPDFQVLRVPGLNMTKIAGDDVAVISHITENTPKAFIVAAVNDTTVPVGKNSLAYYQALWSKLVDSEIHIFQTGEHGLWQPGTSRVWLDLSVNWLNEYVK